MVNKKIVAIFLMAFIWSFAPIFAAGQGWATVDTRLLLILHPEMKDFDYITGRFFRPDAPQKPPAELRKALDAAREKTSPELANLNGREAQLLKQRAETFLYKDTFTNRILNAKIDDATKTRNMVNEARKNFSAWSKKPFQELADPKTEVPIPQSKEEKMTMLASIDRNFTAQVASIDLDLKVLRVQIQAAQEAVYAPIYFTTPETREKMKKIRTEISDIIAQIASEQHIEVVLDNSFGSRPISRTEEITSIPSQLDNPDMISSKLFHDFANWKRKDDIAGPGGKTIPFEHIVPMMQDNKVQQFQRYLESRFYMPAELAEFSTGRMFLIGGTDLTPMVAQKLFSKYSVPASMVNSFLTVIKSFSSLENKKFPPAGDPTSEIK